MKKRGYRTIPLTLSRRNTAVSVYTSPRIADALETIASDLSLYEGVRLMQIFEAVYEQGKKDGARATFAEMERGFLAAKRAIPHQNPGRPRKGN